MGQKPRPQHRANHQRPRRSPRYFNLQVETASSTSVVRHESGAGLWDWAGDHPCHSGLPDLDFQHALQTEITTLDPSFPRRQI